MLLALLLATPLLTVISAIFQPASDVWQHLRNTVLNDYIKNSIILMLGVGSLSVIIGVVTAWLTSMCEFPGQKFFQWALLLPLALPAYIIAFIYGGLTEYSGPIQTFIRDTFQVSHGEYWFPELFSLPGAILMLSLVLYPYVFMLTRAALLQQSVCVLEVSRTLGCGPWKCLLRVALPLARPAIVVGLSLVSMETLADFGTVQYLGIETFTTGIFRTWFGLDDIHAASQLSSLLLGFILILVIAERWSRQRQRYHHTTTRYKSLPSYPLKGIKGITAFILCALPLCLGFIIPVIQLIAWVTQSYQDSINTEFLRLIWHSLSLAALTAILAVSIALFLGYAQRLHSTAWINYPLRFINMGYAMPGTVVAVGIIIPFAWFDNRLDQWMQDLFSISTGLVLSGTLVILVFAYLVRFLSISIQSVESGFSKIKPSMDDAARSLKLKPLAIVKKIHIPMMRGALLTALLLVFVDVLKELPATLVLRPFDFNTLAVHAYELAANEQITQAAPAALAIVASGLIPVILLSRSIHQSRPGQEHE